MTLLADVEEFVADHRPHGTLTGGRDRAVLNGYLLTWRARVGWCLSGG